MNAKSESMKQSSVSRWTWLAATAIAVGTLDMAFATAFWGLKGVAAARVWQSVASGMLGRDAFLGGGITAALGLVLHFAIAFLMVLAYDLAASRLRWLLRWPWLTGPFYGLVLYFVMNFVVLPLSAAGPGSRAGAWVIGSVLAHVFLVGLPCALGVSVAHVRGKWP
jgi:hypothetical protein